MSKKVKRPNKAERIFDTVADVASLLMSLFYVLYVTLLLIFDIGTLWLNYSMLGITIAYITFFLIKIFALNRIVAQKKAQKVTRLALRYSKWAMKLINAAFVALTLATGELSDKHIISMIGIMVVGFSFIISMLWDITWFVLKRKMSDVKSGWDGLSQEDKDKRVENILLNIVKSLDNFTGLDITRSVSRSANRIARANKEKRKQEKKDKWHWKQKTENQEVTLLKEGAPKQANKSD